MNFTVKVRPFPGETKEFNSQETITVERAISLAAIENPKNWTPKINGETVRFNDVISEDTTVLLIRKEIKGNQ